MAGMPVHAGATGGLRLGQHGGNQLPCHALPARGRYSEQVLQVAGVLRHQRVAVKHIVRQPQQLAPAPGQPRVQRLGRVEEALPGQLADSGRQRQRAVAAIKGVVGVP